jgi:hypothetical protein
MMLLARRVDTCQSICSAAAAGLGRPWQVPAFAHRQLLLKPSHCNLTAQQRTADFALHALSPNNCGTLF